MFFLLGSQNGKMWVDLSSRLAGCRNPLTIIRSSGTSECPPIRLLMHFLFLFTWYFDKSKKLRVWNNNQQIGMSRMLVRRRSQNVSLPQMGELNCWVNTFFSLRNADHQLKELDKIQAVFQFATRYAVWILKRSKKPSEKPKKIPRGKKNISPDVIFKGLAKVTAAWVTDFRRDFRNL